MSAALRPLGAFERVAFGYATRRPYQFVTVARFEPAVSPAELAAALAAVQASRPMLRVAVTPAADPATPPHFRAHDVPIPLRVAVGGDRWEQTAAAAMGRRLDPATGPLIEATLLGDADGAGDRRGDGAACRVMVTISHVVCDGEGVLTLFTDLTAALDGRRLDDHPMPAAQESFAGFTAVDTGSAGPQPERGASVEDAADPRPPFPVDPDLGRALQIRRRRLEPRDVDTLRAAARRHRVTVHAALGAAAGQALAGPGRDVVNIGSAFDLRHVIGLPADVAVRFLGAHTVLAAAHEQDFWALARRVRRSLTASTSRPAVDAALTGMAALGPVSPDEADAALCADTHADVLISNLGVYQPAEGGRHRLTDLEGLVLAMGVQHEQVLTVVTCRDTMWLTHAAREPVDGLLDDIVDRLLRARAVPA